MSYTNVRVYGEIVYENHSEMVEDIERNRTPKEGGGYIIQYDPNQTSFKKSMVVVVFAGMWLEAIFHQHMVNNHSKSQFKNHSKDSYKDKLILLGINDNDILDKANKFQKLEMNLFMKKHLWIKVM